MKLFSYPADLFVAWALLALTLTAVITIAANKRLAKRQKYLALSLTFFIAGTLALIASYSLVLCVAVCFLMATFCSVKFFKAGREDQKQRLLPTEDYFPLDEGQNVNAYLLTESDPRPLPNTRLISTRRG